MPLGDEIPRIALNALVAVFRRAAALRPITEQAQQRGGDLCRRMGVDEARATIVQVLVEWRALWHHDRALGGEGLEHTQAESLLLGRAGEHVAQLVQRRELRLRD